MVPNRFLIESTSTSISIFRFSSSERLQPFHLIAGTSFRLASLVNLPLRSRLIISNSNFSMFSRLLSGTTLLLMISFASWVAASSSWRWRSTFKQVKASYWNKFSYLEDDCRDVTRCNSDSNLPASIVAIIFFLSLWKEWFDIHNSDCEAFVFGPARFFAFPINLKTTIKTVEEKQIGILLLV